MQQTAQFLSIPHLLHQQYEYDYVIFCAKTKPETYLISPSLLYQRLSKEPGSFDQIVCIILSTLRSACSFAASPRLHVLKIKVIEFSRCFPEYTQGVLAPSIKESVTLLFLKMCPNKVVSYRPGSAQMTSQPCK